MIGTNYIEQVQDRNISIYKKTIIIAVCTLHRADKLKSCLYSLAQLTAWDQVCDASLEVLVINNDPADKAVAGSVNAVNINFPYPLTLIEAPRRGYSEARNAAVAYALVHGAKFLAFVDDDDEVDKAWLCNMLACQQHTQADIVTGPCVTILPSNAQKWHRGCVLFSPHHRLTGTTIGKAYTNNILIQANVLRAIVPAFNKAFNTIGGEDSHFSTRAKSKGFKIIWCDDGVVNTYIAADRLTFKWLMQRGLRNGLGWYVSRKLLFPKCIVLDVGIYTMARGGRALLYFLYALIACNSGKLASSVFYFCVCAGTVKGLFSRQLSDSFAQ